MTLFWKYFIYIFLANLIVVLLTVLFPLEQYPLSKVEVLSQNKLQIFIFIILSLISALTVSSLLSNKINTSLSIIMSKIRSLIDSENSDYKSHNIVESDFFKLENSIKEMNSSHNQAISQLKSEKNQLLVLVNAINEGVVVVSKDGQIVLSNNEFKKMFEIQGNLDGRPYWEVIRISEITNLIESALNTRKSAIKEVNLIYPYEKFYFVNIITLDSPQDEIIAIFYDITEFKNLEKIKAELIANVSHELRTPSL